MKNKQYWPSLPKDPVDWEFTSILIARPLAAVILYPFKDTISPNTVTFISLLSYLAGIFLLWLQVYSWSFPLLFLGMILDDGDGLIARYQGTSSLLGSFFDKIADVLRFGALFSIVGWLGFKQTQDPMLPYLGAMAGFGLMVQGYTKWIVKTQYFGINEEGSQGFFPIKNKIKGMAVALLWPFHECDLTLWTIILSFFEKFKLLTHVFAWSQLLAAVIAIISRFMLIKKTIKHN